MNKIYTIIDLNDHKHRNIFVPNYTKNKALIEDYDNKFHYLFALLPEIGNNIHHLLHPTYDILKDNYICKKSKDFKSIIIICVASFSC